MAALTLQSTPNADNSHSVAKSTDDAIGSASAAIIVDNTKPKIEIMDSLRAAMRALSREFGKVNAAADVSTSGTTTE